jgi:hypothetical protein
VQYTPYAFAARGINLALPLWLRARASRERVTVMFHEVMYPVRAGQPLRHNLLGRAHRWMATMLVGAAHRALVSTPRWTRILRDSCGATCPIEWAPVPSNLPTAADPARVADVRARFVQPAGLLVGHFGTYGPLIASLLAPIVRRLLADEGRRMILIGRGSRDFCVKLTASHPSLRGRLVATGVLREHETAAHLAACDLLVQPYPDGVTTRRSSIMAGLALGVPTVTNSGELTEALWADEAAVSLAPGPDPSSIIEHADALIGDAARRRALSPRARLLYRDRFAVERTVEILRARDRDSP